MRVGCRDLGRMDYAAAWELQRQLFDAMVARKAACRGAGGPQRAGGRERAGAVGGPDRIGAAESPEEAGCAPAAGAADDAGVILLVEHDPVYTLGKSGREENLLVDPARLEALGARFYRIDRGGDVTFHGPGQIVGYPILDLERLGLGLRDYIAALEEAVIRTVARYGIEAGRIAGASGVWIDDGRSVPRKICAIGVRSSRYITMHGFALNVSTDLSWFGRINPCGFADRGVASIERETGRRVAMGEVKLLLVDCLGEALGVRIEPADAGGDQRKSK